MRLFKPKPDFHAYIPFVNRPDITSACVDSIKSLWPNLTILDNSPEGLGGRCPCAVYRPPVPLTFSQSQNFFFSDARRRGARFMVWLHNDVIVPDGVFPELLDLARAYSSDLSACPRWGVLYTYYDIISAVNLEAAESVNGYDTSIRAYKSDQDFYRRLDLAGWERVESHIKTEEIKSAHVGSQTIASDLKLRYLNGIIQTLDAAYYMKKWGGDAGMERFFEPFNGEC